MNKEWRRGSKEFIDFAVTLQDPDGEMTLAEVQAIDFKVLVQQGVSTPDRASAEWIPPSVDKVATQVGEAFKVEIRHLYEALETGLHSVYVKFGPTPEEPIYQAVTFVVL